MRYMKANGDTYRQQIVHDAVEAAEEGEPAVLARALSCGAGAGSSAKRIILAGRSRA